MDAGRVTTLNFQDLLGSFVAAAAVLGISVEGSGGVSRAGGQRGVGAQFVTLRDNTCRRNHETACAANAQVNMTVYTCS